jgi:hypothetical protein
MGVRAAETMTMASDMGISFRTNEKFLRRRRPVGARRALPA